MSLIAESTIGCDGEVAELLVAIFLLLAFIVGRMGYELYEANKRVAEKKEKGQLDTFTQEDLFGAWTRVVDSFDLIVDARAQGLGAPPLFGIIHDVSVTVELDIRHAGSTSSELDSLRAATTLCEFQFTTPMMFPWTHCTIQNIAVPEADESGDSDDIDLGFELSNDKELAGIRLPDDGRAAMLNLIENCESVDLHDGAMQVVATDRPPRARGRWIDWFGAHIDRIGTQISTVARTGIEFDLANLPADLDVTVRIQPPVKASKPLCTVAVEIDLPEWPASVELHKRRHHRPGDGLSEFNDLYTITSARHRADRQLLDNDGVSYALGWLAEEFESVVVEAQTLQLRESVRCEEFNRTVEQIDDLIEIAGGAALELQKAL